MSLYFTHLNYHVSQGNLQRVHHNIAKTIFSREYASYLIFDNTEDAITRP